MSCVPFSWWCILKDDRHEGLANGALPSFCYFPPNATVGRHLARRWRCLRDSLRVAGSQRGEDVGVLPYKVAHSACDKLEAVGICPCGDKIEVSSGTHFQDFRQRDLLQEDGPMMRLHLRRTKGLEITAFHGVNYTYLVVFVGGVVLEKDDALTVQTPVVPLSLLVVRARWDESGQQDTVGR